MRQSNDIITIRRTGNDMIDFRYSQMQTISCGYFQTIHKGQWIFGTITKSCKEFAIDCKFEASISDSNSQFELFIQSEGKGTVPFVDTETENGEISINLTQLLIGGVEAGGRLTLSFHS